MKVFGLTAWCASLSSAAPQDMLEAARAQPDCMLIPPVDESFPVPKLIMHQN